MLNRIAVPVTLALLSGFATLACAQSNPDLPEMGNPAGTLADLDDEYEIGRMVIQELRDQNALFEDPECGEYLESLGLRLSSQAPDSSRVFHYIWANDGEINAEALPGAFIIVNYGTMLASDNESELAGVLAHETAHIVQRHLVRGALQAEHASIETAAAMLGAILLGALGGGAPAIEGGILAAQGMGAQMQINFTRDEEYEADRVGMGFLSSAGFDPYGMPNFFEALTRQYGYGMELYVPKMLINHPVTRDRIAEARNRAAQMAHPKNLKDSISYGLVKERLRVLTAPDTFDLRAYYAKRMSVQDPPLAIRYGQALALYQRDHAAQAVELLKPLVQENQGVIMLYSLLGQAEMAAGQQSAALATFEHAENLFPRNVPLTVRYAETLIKASRPKQAYDLLLDLFNNAEPTPEQIKLTAMTASGAGNAGDASYYMGEYYISNGQLPLAVQQLQLALASPDITVIQRKRFEARLKEVRDVLAEDRRVHGASSQNSGG